MTSPFDNVRVGWTIGGGVEYAITNNWSIRAEYRFTEHDHFDEFEAASTGSAFSIRKNENDNAVRAGFSYKFDAPPFLAPPVVAKYQSQSCGMHLFGCCPREAPTAALAVGSSPSRNTGAGVMTVRMGATQILDLRRSASPA